VAYMRLLKIAMAFEKVFLTIKNVLDRLVRDNKQSYH
jgi:hypothetical protein